MRYTNEQLFDLVSDIEDYACFLPWCKKSVVHSRSDQEIYADLTVGFGPFDETFSSRVQLSRPKIIRVLYEDGPFRYLNNVWMFIPDRVGCRVNFSIDFEFNSRVLQLAIGSIFGEAVRSMVSAFQRRADERYGVPLHSAPRVSYLG